MHDPRPYQIAVLSALLLYGLLALDFDLRLDVTLGILAAAQLSQWMATRLVGLPRFDPRSALISSLSLCLLLRTASLPLAATAALVTIASKFLLRVRGKHVFNPTNLGLAMMMLVSDEVWISPGQWGSVAFFAFLVAGLGGLVVYRAERSDVTWAFFAAWAAVVFGRALWLGDPPAIPLHQLENGAFLIFAFFMISDPKTTPDRRAGRVLFAALVAVVAGWIQFGLYRPNALIWALVLSAPAVPLIDRVFPGPRYIWKQRSSPCAESSPSEPRPRSSASPSPSLSW